MTISLGEQIRRVRTRLRKNQGEFAEILGSQQTSVSRYEKDKVQPGLGMLWKLHGLAEPDQKEVFATEIRRQIVGPIAGRNTTVEGSMEELRPTIMAMIEFQEWHAIAGGREDKTALLLATRQLLQEKRIDKSIIEILTLWVEHREQKGAVSILRATAVFLRERLEGSARTMKD